MPRTVEYLVDCDNKIVTVRWKVLITGSGSRESRSEALQVMFRLRFNPNPPFRIGDCTVRFEIDAREDEDLFDRQFQEALLDGDRDVIDIAEDRPGGGGFWRRGRNCNHVHINPDANANGRLSEWKTINEMGHGLGIEDRHQGMRGEWNLEGNPPRDVIRPSHIEEVLNKAPDAIKQQINRCCGAHLTAAAEPRAPVEFPDRPFEGRDPRDAAWEIFPPGSGNPFDPGYEEKMRRWQELVRRYGLTEAYRRWRESEKTGGKKGKKAGKARKRRAKARR